MTSSQGLELVPRYCTATLEKSFSAIERFAVEVDLRISDSLFRRPLRLHFDICEINVRGDDTYKFSR